jgi:hypothetical protein
MHGGIIMELQPQLSAIKLVWNSAVTEQGVREGFNRVQAQLTESESPQYIIMDISTNPQFPLKETTAAALFGPYRHPMLLEWLIIGDSEQWHFVEHMLHRATNERKMRWFDTLEAVETYIHNQFVRNN